MEWDSRKLLGRIIEKCGTRSEFANRMGWSARTTTLKLSGRIDWKQGDILNAAEILDIPQSEIANYFF